MLDLVRITLESVGYSIFNIVFLFGVWVVFLINRRLNRIDIYRIIKKKSMINLMADILVQSILVGSLVSFLVVIIGIPLYFNEFLLFLIPISLLLSMVRIRFLDFSYGVALICFLSLIMDGQTHIASLILLVGIISLIKGLLILLTKEQSVIPVLSRKDNQIVLGHIIHKSWILPIGLLILQIGELATQGIQMPTWWPMIQYSHDQNIFYTMFPFVAFMSHNSISYTQTLQKHQKQSGYMNIIFGVLLLLIGVLAVENLYVQIMGSLIMIVFPEGMHHAKVRKEKKQPPIYTHPENGLRIMEVIHGGIADEIGMELGEVIEKVNDTFVQDIKHFLRMVKEAEGEIVIESRTIAGRLMRYEIHKSKDLTRMGVRFIPEKPLIVYSMEGYNQIGLFDFLKGKY